jgi:hypothetical protein
MDSPDKKPQKGLNTNNEDHQINSVTPLSDDMARLTNSQDNGMTKLEKKL